MKWREAGAFGSASRKDSDLNTRIRSYFVPRTRFYSFVGEGYQKKIKSENEGKERRRMVFQISCADSDLLSFPFPSRVDFSHQGGTSSVSFPPPLKDLGGESLWQQLMCFLSTSLICPSNLRISNILP